MGKKGVLLLNQAMFTKKQLSAICEQTDILVAVDGGGNLLAKYEMLPDFLLGDMDTLTAENLAFFEQHKVKIEHFNQDKALTDGHLALNLVLEQAVDSIWFLGSVGLRLDQCLGVLGLMAEVPLPCYYVTRCSVSFFVQGNCKICSRKGQRFSLIVWEKDTYVTLKGVQYPLINHLLQRGDDLTIANQVVDRCCSLSTNKRLLVVFYGKRGIPKLCLENE